MNFLLQPSNIDIEKVKEHFYETITKFETKEERVRRNTITSSNNPHMREGSEDSNEQFFVGKTNLSDSDSGEDFLEENPFDSGEDNSKKKISKKKVETKHTKNNSDTSNSSKLKSNFESPKSKNSPDNSKLKGDSDEAKSKSKSKNNHEKSKSKNNHENSKSKGDLDESKSKGDLDESKSKGNNFSTSMPEESQINKIQVVRKNEDKDVVSI